MVVDGFALFVPEIDLKLLVAQRLGMSERTATVQLYALRDLGVYKAIAGGRGKPFKRYLKLDALEVVEAAESKTRSGRKAAPAKPEPEPSAPGEGGGVPATPEQLNELWTQLSAKLDEYGKRIEELERELADERQVHQETKNELTQVRVELEASVSKPVFVLPEALAKHLG
ncbi:hypothetical protein HYU82_00975 [Candidatus Saccharibacteria bacterium]|nr:hypothetical protein [Candidatus Saccharibacteria bacterium]